MSEHIHIKNKRSGWTWFIVFFFVIITAVLVGGGVYLWQQNVVKDLQNEILREKNDRLSEENTTLKIDTTRTKIVQEETPAKKKNELTELSFNDYQFSYPSSWKISDTEGGKAFSRANGTKIAELMCPIIETGYEAWDFDIIKRSLANPRGGVYGVTYWRGTPAKPSAELMADDLQGVLPISLVFMHRNSFDKWWGEGNKDAPFSCQLAFWDARDLDETIEKIYQSVKIKK